MTPAQRRNCRDILRARADTIQLTLGSSWLLDAARDWAINFDTRTQPWWGACAMIVRAERVAGTRALTPDMTVDVLALLDQLRVAVGGSVDDSEFRNPAAP